MIKELWSDYNFHIISACIFWVTLAFIEYTTYFVWTVNVNPQLWFLGVIVVQFFAFLFSGTITVGFWFVCFILQDVGDRLVEYYNKAEMSIKYKYDDDNFKQS
jgi:hypothetical protein